MDRGLEVRGLARSFQDGAGERRVLSDLSLAVAPGESVAILGPSGSGKSTLLHCIGALDHPSAGTIRLAGEALESLSPDEACRYRETKVGFVFQEHYLLPSCTALENVCIPQIPRGERSPTRGLELLGRVGLRDRAAAFPGELSGGERQRVALARALINRPPLLLADEPTGNLDRVTGDAIVEMLLALVAEEERILLFVTHDPHLAARMSRQFLLSGGRLEEIDR